MLLLVALGVYASTFLFKRRFDSNVPLLFYGCVLVFTVWAGREIGGVVFVAGLLATLTLRFEFMNRFFTTAVLSVALLMLAAVAYRLAAEALGVRGY